MRPILKFSLLFFCLLSFKLFAKELTVLHTNDLHSRILGGKDYKEHGKFKKLGHYAKLSYLIKKSKENLKGASHILVDGGDFYSGSLFHILGPRKNIDYNPEIDFFLYNNYHATTLGNHEFDAREVGLANMLSKLEKKNHPFRIVSTNAKISKESSLHKFKDKLILKSYIVKLPSNIKVGLIGLLGPDGSRVSRTGRKNLSFFGYNEEKDKDSWNELYTELQIEVLSLKDKGVDFVVALMHGGDPEDEKIATNVQGIDLIVAGHKHSVYEKPKKVLNTFIVQAGSYGQYLGKVTLSKREGILTLKNKDFIHKVLPETPKDEIYDSLVESYSSAVDKVLAPTKRKSNDVIFTPKKSYPHRGEGSLEYGRKIISHIRSEANGKLSEKIDFYFSARSLIREGLYKEKSYKLHEIFQVLPIGMDEKFNPGSPIVTFYLSKHDVKKLISFLELYSKFSPLFTPLYADNISFSVRSWGIPFLNRITNLKMNGKSFEQWPEYLKVGTNSYVGAYLDKIGSMSFGLLKFTTRNIKGLPVKDITVTNLREFLLLSSKLEELGHL